MPAKKTAAKQSYTFRVGKVYHDKVDASSPGAAVKAAVKKAHAAGFTWAEAEHVTLL